MNLSLADSFAGRSVFVTGHTGFKGSWLCLWLERLGAEVTGYALEPPTNPNNFTSLGIDKLLRGHHEADIRDRQSLRSALKQAAPDVVLHLAAQSVVRKGYQIPHETFDVNVMGMSCLLSEIMELGRPCVVVAVTSDKCYENREQIWGYRESDPLGEHDPYGASKGAAELVARCYRHSFFPPEQIAQHGVKLATARAGNVIGGGDWTPDALVVDIVRALSKGQPVQVRNPHATRPWQHVLQALSGYLTLASRMLQSDDPDLCGGWNFGPQAGSELPVRQIVELFLREWGEGSWEDASSSDQPHESTILRLAIDKALWQLKWRPQWSVEEALRQTARWYRQYFKDNGSMRHFSLDQIEAYEDALGSCSNSPDVLPV
jgi:CDP-glucose 4,6-dehydratase